VLPMGSRRVDILVSGAHGYNQSRIQAVEVTGGTATPSYWYSRQVSRLMTRIKRDPCE
jgi:hypothetical protein